MKKTQLRGSRTVAGALALAAVLALATLLSGCGTTTTPAGSTTPTSTPTAFHALVIDAAARAPGASAITTTLRIVDPATGHQLWNQQLNGYPGGYEPAVVGEVVVASIGIPAQPYPGDQIDAFNLKTGAALWHKDLGTNTQGFVFAAGSSVILVTSPVSTEAPGASSALTVTALNPTTGAQIWQRVLAKLELASGAAYTNGTVLVPAVQTGSVPGDYSMTALNATSGAQIWQKSLGTGTLMSTIAGDGRVYASMYAGHPMVKAQPGGPFAIPLAMPLDAAASPLPGTLTAYSASDGAQLWQAQTFTTARALSGGALYAINVAARDSGSTGLADFTVVAYNAVTGAEQWHSTKLASADPFGMRPLVAADGQAAYVFDMPEDTPSVHALAGATGTELWKALPNSSVYDGAAGLGKVFVGGTASTPSGQQPVTQSGSVYALDATSGSTAWTMTVDNSIGIQLVLV